RLRRQRAPVRAGHRRPAERPQPRRVPADARQAADPVRQHLPDPQQGGARRRPRHRPDHPALPPGLQGRPALRPGGLPLDQHGHAGAGLRPHGRGLPQAGRLPSRLPSRRRAGQGQRRPRGARPHAGPLQALRPEPPPRGRERLVNLSERLGAVEAEEAEKPRRPRPAAVAARPAPAPTATERPARDDAAPHEDGPKPARTRRAHAGWEGTKKRVRDLVLADLGPKLTGSKRIGSELEKEVKAALDRTLQREDVRISPAERSKFVAEVLSDILGYGPLDGLLADPTVTEIMCNAYDQIWVERRGVIEPTDLAFTDDAQYRQVIDKIVSAVGRRVDESSPMVDARLPDGSRVNAIIPPLSLNGPTLTIRKFADDPYTVADLINFGSMTMDLALF